MLFRSRTTGSARVALFLCLLVVGVAVSGWLVHPVLHWDGLRHHPRCALCVAAAGSATLHAQPAATLAAAPVVVGLVHLLERTPRADECHRRHLQPRGPPILATLPIL